MLAQLNHGVTTCLAVWECIILVCIAQCIYHEHLQNEPFDSTQTLLKKSFSINCLVYLFFATSIFTCFSQSATSAHLATQEALHLSWWWSLNLGLSAQKAPKYVLNLKHWDPRTQKAQYKRRWMRILLVWWHARRAFDVVTVLVKSTPYDLKNNKSTNYTSRLQGVFTCSWHYVCWQEI